MHIMTELADLFPGFEARDIHTRGAKIHCRTGGSGPPLVLIHGFPQTHVEWHKIAPELAKRFTLVMPDLRGYGWSSTPDPDDKLEAYSKRAMAEDIIDVMEDLGHVRFSVVGHDRGARVGYRLAFDHPARVRRLAVIDIVPTAEMWGTMDAARAMKVYHWMFLAQPAPLPETLIGPNTRMFIDHTLASWTAKGDLSAFDRRALSHYRAFFNVPERLAATCWDYRAGSSVDRNHDEADLAAGHKIEAPLLVLWGNAGIPAAGNPDAPLGVWRQYALDVRGQALAGGHFLPEENPADTLKALLEFL
jgi:haloacetate dehalogenase